jgi:hypothetical protein
MSCLIMGINIQAYIQIFSICWQAMVKVGEGILFVQWLHAKEVLAIQPSLYTTKKSHHGVHLGWM